MSGDFSSAVRSTIERGLPIDRALAAVTTEAAAIIGCADQYGRISEGTNATLTVLDGAPFGEKTKVVEVWIDGERFAITQTLQQDLRGSWELTLHRKQDAVALELEITGSAKKPRLNARFDGEKLQPAAIHRLGNEVGFTLPASPLRDVGFLRLGGVYGGGDRFEGSARTPDGNSIRFTAVRTGEASDTAAGESEAAEEGEETSDENESGWSRRGPRRGQKSLDPEVWAGSADETLPTPLGARGRTSSPPAPETIFVTGGTIWTSGPKGILEDADLLIRNGKIVDVGQDLSAPTDALVIDATDRYLTPGIIDPHSHTAIIGGVNEGTQAVTAEVRIGDVVNANDINLYRQLAGGLTTAHLMHGSANPIGGQGQVIKLKWGEPPERLKIEGPLLIKCALGENVKQSNWDNPTGRYPQTRMGVEQVFRDAFWAAREYSAQWQRVRNSEKPIGCAASCRSRVGSTGGDSQWRTLDPLSQLSARRNPDADASGRGLRLQDRDISTCTRRLQDRE